MLILVWMQKTYNSADIYFVVRHYRMAASPLAHIIYKNTRGTGLTDFEKIWSFENLYKAHKKARFGKRNKTEVIEFEMNLSKNLTELSDAIRLKTYRLGGYYHFMIYDPKEREIQALHYADRVVQHCICDEVLQPLLDKRLIYDNAACRKAKGTLFAINRTTKFIQKFYWQHGAQGYVLKCDIRKYFDSIDHAVLKAKIRHVISDDDVYELLEYIIDSYEKKKKKGLPMGNQTSQWFALFYLDGFDRMIKEQFQIKYYSRYMDDCVLIHKDRLYLSQCKNILTGYLKDELKLEFNNKTQVFPLKNGVDYLGFHFYISESGAVIKKVRRRTKIKYKRALINYKKLYPLGKCSLEEVTMTINSYKAHLSHGDTWRLQKKILSEFVLTRSTD